MCQYKVAEGAITHCVFKANSEIQESYHESSSFFLGTSTGSVYYTDDGGHCSEEIKQPTPILSMLMLNSTSTLVVINEDLLLSQYNFSSDGKIERTTEFKLSVSLQCEKKAVIVDWAGNGILAICSVSNSVKMWDLISEESYILSSPGASILSCIF